MGLAPRPLRASGTGSSAGSVTTGQPIATMDVDYVVSQGKGTSLMVIVLTALSATVTNLRNGLVEVPTALVAGLVGMPAGLIGAAVGQWLPDQVALALFAVLLGWSGIRMIRRSRAAEPGETRG